MTSTKSQEETVSEAIKIIFADENSTYNIQRKTQPYFGKSYFLRITGLYFDHVLSSSLNV